MEDAINVRDILQALKKRMMFILLITLLGAGISAGISFYLITPKYETTTTILVNESKNNQEVVSSSQTVTNQAVMGTYSVVIKSSKILTIVGAKLDKKISATELKKMITVGSEEGSQVITISVLDTDPKRAAKIANTTAAVFLEEVVKIMKIDNVSVLDEARETGPFVPVSPNSLQNIAFGLVIGLVLGLEMALLIDYFDNTIKDEEDIEKLLNAPVLGVISKAGSSKKAKNVKQNQKAKGESVSV